MKTQTIKKVFALLLCVAMTCFGAATAIAAPGMTDAGISGSKTAATVHLDDATRQTEVTLQIPAVKETDEYDIVFVMDDSSSTSLMSGTFIQRVTDLLDGIVQSGVNVNVGVVKFKGFGYDAIDLATSGAQSGLVRYDTTTAPAIMDGINLTGIENLSNGTNIHGGLKLANSWLAADNDVADNHKYVILLTDGKTYIWNDDNDVATTIYAQAANNSINLTSSQYPVPTVGNQVSNKTKELLASNSVTLQAHVDFFSGHGYTFDPFLVGYSADSTNGLASDYQALFDYNGPLLDELSKTDGTAPYDTRSYYSYKEDGTTASMLDGTAVIRNITNGAQLNNSAWIKTPVFTPTAGGYSDGAPYLEFDPYELIDNGDNTYAYDFNSPNPDFFLNHVDPTQKATYLAGHLWADMDTRYNTAAIGYTSSYSGGRQNQQAFMKWLLQTDVVSDFATNVTDATAIDNFFDAIENDINYLIKTGTVTDEITDDFDLVKNGTDTFTVKVDGTVVTGVADGTDKWNFGTENAGTYPYVVEYNEATKTITWKINVPVEDTKPISLTYTLEIGEGADTGDYDTNKSATLEYEAYNGKTGSYTFQKPTVDYTYSPITNFELTKTYLGATGYDNAGDPVTTADGILAEDVSFTIAPYNSFNREIGKTTIPAFDPATYTISVGDGTDKVTVDLPDYATAGLGDYWYKVTETAGSSAGVTYDSTEYYLHVVVISRGTGYTVNQVTFHKSAPNADGSFTNTAADKTLGFTNEYGAGTLTVTKELTGNMADNAKTFDVNVTFTAPAGKTVNSVITYGASESIAAGWTGDKTVTLTLGKGDSVTFSNIPDGVTYTVKEADYSADGYDIPVYEFDNASETGDAIQDDSTWAGTYAAGTIGDSADTVTITNNKDATVDVGVVLETAPFVLIIALVAGSAITVFVRRKRKIED